MGDIAERLAGWSTRFDLEALPSAGLDLARLAFVDTLGVALAGSTLPALHKLKVWCASPAAGEPGASLFGFPEKKRVLDAALLNGAAAHAQLFDDTNMVMVAHPSGPLVASLLALGQTRGCSGRAVLQAYAVGVEVGIKLGRLLNPKLYETGWHATSVLGVLAVSAACARLMELDAGQCRMALGIAASMSHGLRQNFGTMTMGLHAGLAARDGLHAALLAADGFEADPDALEGDYGFCKVYGGWSGKPLDNLGDPHELLSSGLLFKPYPSGAPTVASVDAALAIHGQIGPVGQQQVEKIICRVHPWNFKTLREGLPATGLFGKVSLRYCVARALATGSLQLAHFTDEAVHEPGVVALMKQIDVEADTTLPDNGEFPAEVELRLAGGRKITERREHPLGSSASPMDAQAVERKFRECAAPVLAGKHIEEVLALLATLRELPDVTQLCELLESGPPD